MQNIYLYRIQMTMFGGVVGTAILLNDSRAKKESFALFCN